MLILAFAAEPAQAFTGARSAVSEVNAPGPDLHLGGYVRAEWLVDVGMLPHAATGPGLALGLWSEQELAARPSGGTRYEPERTIDRRGWHEAVARTRLRV